MFIGLSTAVAVRSWLLCTPCMTSLGFFIGLPSDALSCQASCCLVPGGPPDVPLKGISVLLRVEPLLWYLGLPVYKHRKLISTHEEADQSLLQPSCLRLAHCPKGTLSNKTCCLLARCAASA